MTAEVSNRLETSVQRWLGGGLANFVPRRAGVQHFDRGVACFFGGFDLLGVLVTVTDFQRQGVIPDVAFDVDAEIDLHTIALLEHHVAVPALNAFDLVVGGEMSRKVVHGDGPGESRLSTVSMNEALSGFDDFVKGLARLELILHGFKGATGHMPRISPILQVGFFHH